MEVSVRGRGRVGTSISVLDFSARAEHLPARLARMDTYGKCAHACIHARAADSLRMRALGAPGHFRKKRALGAGRALWSGAGAEADQLDIFVELVAQVRGPCEIAGR